MEQLDGFDAAEQLSPEYLTQVGDVIIRLTSPYTAVLIDEASAGMVVSSNFVIIRANRSRLIPRLSRLADQYAEDSEGDLREYQQQHAGSHQHQILLRI